MEAASTDSDPRRKRRAMWALLLVTLLWGWTFVWMKEVMVVGARHMGEAGPWPVILLFMTLRFGLAAGLAPLVLRGSVRKMDRGTWSDGTILGLVLLLGFLAQMWGLQRVTPSVSAFLTSLYVLFTLLLTVAAKRRMPGRALIFGVALATFGAGFISGPPQVHFGPGESATVACAVLFAIHILVTDRVTKRRHPASISLASFTVVGVLSGLGLGVVVAGGGGDGLGALMADAGFLRPLLLSSLLATLLALGLMNQFQRDLAPVRAAVLYALEPVWTAIIALGLGFDEPRLWLWIGGGALITGNLVAELGGSSPRSTGDSGEEAGPCPGS